jgi:RNA polymerase sigma factor (sigma-70 family)
MGQATDAELWRRAVDGDPDAFGVLFERHARPVYNYLFRRTADWALAEDLTSVVFLEAWRRRADVRLDHETALPWLFGVATNVLRNRRRSQRRHRAALERIPRERDPGFADDTNARLDDERRMRSVLRSLAALPKREQDVIALCAWSELSYEEAALALGIPSALCAHGYRGPGAGSGNSTAPPDMNGIANLLSRHRRHEGERPNRHPRTRPSTRAAPAAKGASRE